MNADELRNQVFAVGDWVLVDGCNVAVVVGVGSKEFRVSFYGYDRREWRSPVSLVPAPAARIPSSIEGVGEFYDPPPARETKGSP